MVYISDLLVVSVVPVSFPLLFFAGWWVYEDEKSWRYGVLTHFLGQRGFTVWVSMFSSIILCLAFFAGAYEDG